MPSFERIAIDTSPLLALIAGLGLGDRPYGSAWDSSSAIR